MATDSGRIGKYLLFETLGRGAFSKVKLGRNGETGDYVAIKIMDKNQVQEKGVNDVVKKEVSILKSLKHKNVIRLYEVLTSKTKIYMVMEYCPNGDLFDVIDATECAGLEEDKARKYFQQIVDAVAYCHKRGVYHRDIKPENLLLGVDGQLKMTDFGLSALREREDKNRLLHTFCGTPAYVAPEVLSHSESGYKGDLVDAWACGVVLYCLLEGCLPFDGDDLEAMFASIQSGIVTFSPRISEESKQIISSLLVTDPEKRMTISQLKENPWFQTNYDLSLELKPSTPKDPMSPQYAAENQTPKTSPVVDPPSLHQFQTPQTPPIVVHPSLPQYQTPQPEHAELQAAPDMHKSKSEPNGVRITLSQQIHKKDTRERKSQPVHEDRLENENSVRTKENRRAPVTTSIGSKNSSVQNPDKNIKDVSRESSKGKSATRNPSAEGIIRTPKLLLLHSAKSKTSPEGERHFKRVETIRPEPFKSHKFFAITAEVEKASIPGIPKSGSGSVLGSDRLVMTSDRSVQTSDRSVQTSDKSERKPYPKTVKKIAEDAINITRSGSTNLSERPKITTKGLVDRVSKTMLRYTRKDYHPSESDEEDEIKYWFSTEYSRDLDKLYVAVNLAQKICQSQHRHGLLKSDVLTAESFLEIWSNGYTPRSKSDVASLEAMRGDLIPSLMRLIETYSLKDLDTLALIYYLPPQEDIEKIRNFLKTWLQVLRKESFVRSNLEQMNLQLVALRNLLTESKGFFRYDAFRRSSMSQSTTPTLREDGSPVDPRDVILDPLRNGIQGEDALIVETPRLGGGRVRGSEIFVPLVPSLEYDGTRRLPARSKEASKETHKSKTVPISPLTKEYVRKDRGEFLNEDEEDDVEEKYQSQVTRSASAQKVSMKIKDIIRRAKTWKKVEKENLNS